MKTTKENIIETLNKIKKAEIVSVTDLLPLAAALDQAITKNHTGKMEGLQSLSTSVLLNENCKRNREIDGAVCVKCYAARLAAMRTSLDEKLDFNTVLLTTCVLPVETLPVINSLYFRFESFGDLNNTIQVVNYFNICKKNPLVNFALWTKNPHIIAQAMNEYKIEKPNNINIIYSSLFINQESTGIFKKYSFIDKVFTVYDPQYIKENNIDINCGGRHCAGCLNCYKKNDIRIINEKLK